jgi:hypothetical protein
MRVATSVTDVGNVCSVTVTAIFDTTAEFDLACACVEFLPLSPSAVMVKNRPTEDAYACTILWFSSVDKARIQARQCIEAWRKLVVNTASESVLSN